MTSPHRLIPAQLVEPRHPSLQSSDHRTASTSAATSAPGAAGPLLPEGGLAGVRARRAGSSMTNGATDLGRRSVASVSLRGALLLSLVPVLEAEALHGRTVAADWLPLLAVVPRRAWSPSSPCQEL